jgi:hypothetical protein
MLVAQNNTPSILRALTLQPGFAVYRNTVMKGDIDALQANSTGSGPWPRPPAMRMR